MRNLKVLACWLASQVGVEVESRDVPTASIRVSNGRKVIAIPISWGYSTDPQAYDLLEGVIDHEALGHGRFTSFEVMGEAFSGKDFQKPFLKGLWNILEDIYIERHAIATYPGVKKNLARTVGVLMGRGFFGSPESFVQKTDPSSLVLAGLLNGLRARFVDGQADHFKENLLVLEPILDASLGKLWQDIMAIAIEVEHSTCTKDNLDLALKIAELIEDAAQSQPQEDEANDDSDGGDPSQAGGQGQQQDEGEPTDENGQEQGEGQESGQSNASGEGGEEQGENSDSSAQSGGQGDGEKPSQGQQKSNAPGAGSGGYSQEEIEAAKDIQSRMGDEVDQKLEISDMISEIIESISGESSLSDRLQDNNAKAAISETALMVARQLKSKADDLQDALVTQTRCEARNALAGKRLNGRILSRVATGNPRVFRQKHEAQGLSTAVTVLCDCSGSMSASLQDGVSREDAAFGLMYGVADLLSEFEVPFSLVGYSNYYQTFKEFDGDWSPLRRKKQVPYISGGTITGAAMTKALMELATRPEERRLFVIITDGDTADLEELMSCYSESKLLGVDVATLIVGELVPAVTELANRFGFKAATATRSQGLSKFAVERILEAI